MNAKNRYIQIILLTLLVLIIHLNIPGDKTVHAGGPILVGGDATGGFGPDGQPFVYPTMPIPYRTDGGFLGQLDPGAIDPANTPNGIVSGMFQVWEDVPTSSVAFNRAGSINAVGDFTDGDVNTIAEFNAVSGDCDAANQSPIIYDANGQLFSSLGFSPGVIGFARLCSHNAAGDLLSSLSALNGRYFDGFSAFGEPEFTLNEFQAVFIHEFGHFFNLAHSQINQNCMSFYGVGGCASGSDDAFGLPTMFPFMISGLVEDPVGNPGVHPARTLSADDIAWVSYLYPGPSFSTTFGAIEGKILHSGGLTGVQGANVIARQVDDPATTIDESRRNVVSSTSGFQFTRNPGNLLVGNAGNIFGSTNGALKGDYILPGLGSNTYEVEVSSIYLGFSGGSGVGSLNPPLPSPGPAEFFGGDSSGLGESSSDLSCAPPGFLIPPGCTPGDAARIDAEGISVVAGFSEMNKDIILNGTPPRFDSLDAINRNETFTTATPILSGTHRLSLSPFDTSGDVDFLSFEAPAGAYVKVNIDSHWFDSSLNTFMDSVLEILDSSGTRLNTCRDDPRAKTDFFGNHDFSPKAFNNVCANDDDIWSPDSVLEFNPPHTGTFLIRVSEWRGDARPDFLYDLRLSVEVIPATGFFAIPNNCTLNGNPTCTINFTWLTANTASALVTVQNTGMGGPETNLAGGTSGSQLVPWIQVLPNEYTFRLYDTTSGVRVLLDTRVVTAQTGATGSISASPYSCILNGNASCTTTINWNTTKTASALVTVQNIGIGGPETDFTSGISGSQAAPWIQGFPNDYVFRLYDTTGGARTKLGETSAQARTGATGSITASPNPCPLNGNPTCASMITWNTTNAPSAEVMVHRIGDGNINRTFAWHPFASGTSGSHVAPWLQGRDFFISFPSVIGRYIFLLYETNSQGKQTALLDEVWVDVVRGVTGSITASPTPCILSGNPTCTSSLTWNTTHSNSALVTVQNTGIGGPETDFSGGISGSQSIPWIQARPNAYTFRLYDIYTGRHILLDTVEASAANENTDFISASPKPCTLNGNATCSTTITWNTTTAAWAVVTVQNTGTGGPETHFGEGSFGSQAAPWIQGFPNEYTFRLYDTTVGTLVLMKSVVVTAETGATGFITASPNPCLLSGSPTCTSTLNWNTTNATSALVTVQNAGGAESNFTGGISGSQAAPWIQGATNAYTFRLYDTTGGGMTLLNSVVVTASP